MGIVARPGYFTPTRTQPGYVPEGDETVLSPPGCLASGDRLSGERLPGEGEA